jgi:hypothetical protein
MTAGTPAPKASPILRGEFLKIIDQIKIRYGKCKTNMLLEWAETEDVEIGAVSSIATFLILVQLEPRG